MSLESRLRATARWRLVPEEGTFESLCGRLRTHYSGSVMVARRQNGSAKWNRKRNRHARPGRERPPGKDDRARKKADQHAFHLPWQSHFVRLAFYLRGQWTDQQCAIFTTRRRSALLKFKILTWQWRNVDTSYYWPIATH